MLDRVDVRAKSRVKPVATCCPKNGAGTVCLPG
jgi:hypothetical protein